eukprot:m.238735 g.238735  ORF g.238735 m.238735 type:complete len:140 (-) comp16061_c0_seq6:536-955(-)
MTEVVDIPETILSEEEEYNQLKEEFEKNVVKIINPVKYVNIDKKGNIHYKSEKQIKESYNDYSSWRGIVHTYGRTPKSFLDNWLVDPEDTFNLFRGFPVNEIDNVKYDQDMVDKIRDHKNVLKLPSLLNQLKEQVKTYC